MFYLQTLNGGGLMENLKLDRSLLQKLDTIVQELMQYYSSEELVLGAVGSNYTARCDCGGGCSGSCQGSCGGCGGDCKGSFSIFGL